MSQKFTMNDTTSSQLASSLLELLRCPIGVRDTKHEKPGELTVIHDGHWLHCEQNGYKYPVIKGSPHMIVEVGERWRDVPIEALPVPPTEEM